ncbi:MraY family glycosyltransferase [Indioceanicola profundi]|uniref:glycosyl transferase n=1 Tax=Indioceanicola profundi TaxID=2220096 RepID=UPI001CECC6AB|nr:glycosyl transferase [Indioceanicola profundi]
MLGGIVLSWGLILADSAAGDAVGRMFWLAPGIVLLVGISWLDDLSDMPALARFASQFLAAGAGLMALPDGALLFQGYLPMPLDRILAAVGWVWFMNLYNFMDGIDGITGVETSSIGIGVAAVLLSAGQFVPQVGLAMALAGAGAGFLVWNWHPARVFMGDVGSVPLGFLAGWLLIDIASAGFWIAALLVPAYYLADATLTLVRRAARGEKIWQAHRQHFYQQAARRRPHDQVVLLILSVNTLLIGLAVWSPSGGVASLMLGAVLVSLMLLVFARGASLQDACKRTVNR